MKLHSLLQGFAQFKLNILFLMLLCTEKYESKLLSHVGNYYYSTANEPIHKNVWKYENVFLCWKFSAQFKLYMLFLCYCALENTVFMLPYICTSKGFIWT
jgi:hypothetical protein